jgi:hypothetical protein
VEFEGIAETAFNVIIFGRWMAERPDSYHESASSSNHERSSANEIDGLSTSWLANAKRRNSLQMVGTPFTREGSQVRSLHRPPSSPDKQRWFPDLRKSTLFQWLGGAKRSLRPRFLSFAPAERLERPSVSSDKNSVSKSTGISSERRRDPVKRHSDMAILVSGGRDCWTVNQI